MAGNAPEALEEEWTLILQNSRPGTKVLFRSEEVGAFVIKKAGSDLTEEDIRDTSLLWIPIR